MQTQQVRSHSQRQAIPATGNRQRAVMPRELDPEVRRRMVAEAAYFAAEHRGFAPGHEVEDWLHAEEEVDDILYGGARL